MWKNMRKSNLKIIETKGKMHIQMVHGSSSHSFAISELALQKKKLIAAHTFSKHSQRPSTFS